MMSVPDRSLCQATPPGTPTGQTILAVNTWVRNEYALERYGIPVGVALEIRPGEWGLFGLLMQSKLTEKTFSSPQDVAAAADKIGIGF